MLNALRRVPIDKSEGLIAHLIGELLPDPGIDEVTPLPPDEQALREQVLEELKAKCDIENIYSVEDRPRIIEALSDQLPLKKPGAREKQRLREAIGNQGLLGNIRNKVEFGDVWEKVFGESKTRVREVISNPDEVQHFDDGSATEDKAFSLFSKRIERPARTPFVWLVETIRKGDVHIVQASWKYSLSASRIKERISPIWLLKMFAEEFGVEIEVGDKRGKFFFSQTIPFLSSKSIELAPQDTEFMRVVDMPESRRVVFFNKLRVVSEKKIIEVAHAYAIDMNKYEASLK